MTEPPEFKYSLYARDGIDRSRWPSVHTALLEFLPACAARLIDSTEIQVNAFSLIDDDQLKIIEGLAGTRLAVVY